MEVQTLKLVGCFALTVLSFGFSHHGEVPVLSPEHEKLVASYSMIFLALNFFYKRCNPIT